MSEKENKTEKFINRSKEVHGDFYDYSMVEYINNTTKVIIGCPEHGQFEQSPKIHVKGSGCSKCFYSKARSNEKYTTASFIEKAKAIHGDLYDYSEVEYINAKTKVTIICPVHGRFSQIANKHISGAGCRVCGAKKHTQEDFIRKSKEVHGDFYDYSLVKYENTKKKVTIVCPKHGEFEQLAAVHLRGNGCIECGKTIQANKIKNSPEEILFRFKEAHGDFYDYSQVEYKGANDLVTIVCPKHGEFQQRPSSHERGVGCARCGFDSAAEMRTSTQEEFIEKAKEIHGDRYDYSSTTYHNSTEKITIICPTHGEFKQAPGNHLNGSGCARCGFERAAKERILTTEEFIEKAREIHGDRYDYSLSSYISYQNKTTIICPDHGVFNQGAGAHLQGTGCPKCAKAGPSSGELELVDYLSSLNVAYEQSNRSVLRPKELDIYLPDHNLAIEFNGLYWHSDKFREDSYHQKKSLECMEKGIQLIHVWEDDWDNPIKKEIIKNGIKSKLGVMGRIYARKCSIDSDIQTSEIKGFLIRNHIQGYVTSKYIGLRYNGELVAVLGMKKTKDEGVYDLTRFASSKSVVGGFSKLLSHWKKNNEWKKIITYAHLDYSHGNLYHKNGFTFDGYTKPNFHYSKHGQERESRQTYMKHKLKDRLKHYDPHLTERENMENNGYQRVYGSGSMRFYLENKKGA